MPFEFEILCTCGGASRDNRYNKIHRSFRDWLCPLQLIPTSTEFESCSHICAAEPQLHKVMLQYKNNNGAVQSHVYSNIDELVAIVAGSGLDLIATKVQSSIYILPTSDKIEDEMRNNMYTQSKFCQAVTTVPLNKAYMTRPITAFKKSVILYNIVLNSTTITTCCTIDACWDSETKFPNFIKCEVEPACPGYSPFVTNHSALVQILNKRDFFKYKLLKLMVHCKFANTQDILIGFLSNTQLIDIRLFHVTELEQAMLQLHPDLSRIYQEAESILYRELQLLRFGIQEGQCFSVMRNYYSRQLQLQLLTGDQKREAQNLITRQFSHTNGITR